MDVKYILCSFTEVFCSKAIKTNVQNPIMGQESSCSLILGVPWQFCAVLGLAESADPKQDPPVQPLGELTWC